VATTFDAAKRADVRELIFSRWSAVAASSSDRQARAARPGKLLGVQAGYQTKRTSGRQNAPACATVNAPRSQ